MALLHGAFGPDTDIDPQNFQIAAVRDENWFWQPAV